MKTERGVKIFKYELRTDVIGAPQKLLLPEGSRPLHVGWQVHNRLMLWAEVEPGMPDVTELYYIAFTGEDAPEGLGLKHLRTLNGPSNLVLHVYVWNPDAKPALP